MPKRVRKSTISSSNRDTPVKLASNSSLDSNEELENVIHYDEKSKRSKSNYPRIKINNVDILSRIEDTKTNHDESENEIKFLNIVKEICGIERQALKMHFKKIQSQQTSGNSESEHFIYRQLSASLDEFISLPREDMEDLNFEEGFEVMDKSIAILENTFNHIRRNQEEIKSAIVTNINDVVTKSWDDIQAEPYGDNLVSRCHLDTSLFKS